MNFGRYSLKLSSISLPFSEFVYVTCSLIISLSSRASYLFDTSSVNTIDLLVLIYKSLSSSRTYAIPPLIPAAKFFPVFPSITTLPPVMYSQPWSPTPSTTAVAPELRTQKRSPATPLIKAFPLVAPYKATFPMMMFSSF